VERKNSSKSKAEILSQLVDQYNQARAQKERLNKIIEVFDQADEQGLKGKLIDLLIDELR
jgi:hypothetical protein